MINLFFKLTSGKVLVRKTRSGIVTIDNRPYWFRQPVWVKRMEQGNLRHSIHPWIPCGANTTQINIQKPYLTSDTRKGLAVAMSEAVSRIKVFRLGDAIVYSYLRDLRFVTLTCLLIGISMWWIDVPTLLFQKTVAFQSPDLGLIVRVMKDTYVNKICYQHAVPSPCECGEPLNRTVREIFHPESFDPLHIDKTPTKRAIAFHVATIIIVIALAESVSTSGVMMP